MHCIVKKTLQWVVEHDNHYVGAVKGNQGRLKGYLAQVQATQRPKTKTLELDCSHGRRVERFTRVYPVPAAVAQEWPQAMSMIVIERSGQREGQVFKTLNYYLSDLSLEVETAAQLVHEHWDIENGFHWVRDVVFNKDDSLITQRSPALNWALFRSMAINLFRAAGLMSLTRAIRLFGHDIPALFSLLTTN